MRQVSILNGEPLKISPEREGRLRGWLEETHKRAIDATAGVRRTWKDCLRAYQGTPKTRLRNTPYENAPNIEITVGALACDAIYAQMTDLIFTVKPPLTIRGRRGDEHYAEACQAYVDWGVGGPFNFEDAVKQSGLDLVQLGTKILYIPAVEVVRKTGTLKVESTRPCIYPLRPEDFILPANWTGPIDEAPFCTMQMWLTRTELMLRRRQQKWRTGKVSKAGEEMSDVTQERLKMSGVNAVNKGKYRIMDTYCYFDIDGDDIDEDLEVIWDYTSGEILKVLYNQQDNRPFVKACYQDRAHVPFGVGPMEMSLPYEDEISEIHCARVANMQLANTRMFTGPEEAAGEVAEMYPGKFISNWGGQITPFPMADVYPSSAQSEALTVAYWERRVGIAELSQPNKVGGRTPGMTALTVMQQANRRFAAAFGNERAADSAAVMNCLFRLQECVKSKRVTQKDLIDLVGDKHGPALFEVMKKDRRYLVDAIDVELTAASVSVNREADRQNITILAQTYDKYMQGMFMLEQMAIGQMNGQPVPPPMQELAKQAIKVLNNIMRRYIRTFDSVSETDAFLLHPEDIDTLNAAGAGGLAQHIQQLAQQPPQPGGMPGAPPPGPPMNGSGPPLG